MYSRSCTSSLSWLAVESALAGRAVRLAVPAAVDQAVLRITAVKHTESTSERLQGALALPSLCSAYPTREDAHGQQRA